MSRSNHDLALAFAGAVVSKPTAVPIIMFVAEPVRLARAISCTGRQAPAV